MAPYLEINGLCVSCDYCRLICPEKAILMSPGKYFIETWACTLCGLCTEVCPVDCIKMVGGGKE